MSCTELSLDTRLTKDFFPPEGLPPLPINKESAVVAPWLEAEGDEPVRASHYRGTGILIMPILNCFIPAYAAIKAAKIWFS